MALILVLFLCVVLHELGHALTAKKFNIRTKKITLLPIGGVASLEKMPEKPEQELLVALAGPAVNVVIAILLYLVIPVSDYFSMDPDRIEQLLIAPDFQSFLFYLLIANILLVAFNLIPAFPMDGGRVLRALLSIPLGRVKATAIAASLGQVLAVVFFMLGVFFNPFLILIALFIFVAAYSENQMVKQTSLLEGHKVQDAMLTNITLLHPTNTMQTAVDVLLAGSERDFVITDNDEIVGVLYHKDIIKHANRPSIMITDVMQKVFSTIEASDEVNKIFNLINEEKKIFYPVTNNGKLVGAIDMNNLSEFILLKSNGNTKHY